MGPRVRTTLALGVSAIAIVVPAAAHAQEAGSLLVTPVLPPGFASVEDQGVAERARPDWDALGIRLGAFTLRPEANVDAGVTSNAFLTRSDTRRSAFVSNNAAVDLVSGWSRHYLAVRGSGGFDKYFGNSSLDTTRWSMAASGRYDIHSTLQVSASGDLTRENESRFEGEAVSANFAVSPFIRQTAALRANYAPGKFGFRLEADYRHLHFMPSRQSDGTRIDQSARDRSFTELTAEVTFARTPAIALFAQANANRTRFDDLDPALLLQGNSHGMRVLGGVNLELEGIATGSIGVGWSQRNYADQRLKTRSGLSVEARLELLPEDQTTVTLNARRQLSDANPTVGPFRETLLSVTIDREVRRNFIVSAYARYSRQNYLEAGINRSAAQSGGVSGTYLISRTLEMRSNVVYRTSLTQGARRLNELRGSVGLTFKL